MLVLLLFGTHLYFTVRLGVIQRKLPLGIWLSFTKDSSEILTENEVSPYSALATALVATDRNGKYHRNFRGYRDRRSGGGFLVLADGLSWRCDLLCGELSCRAL